MPFPGDKAFLLHNLDQDLAQHDEFAHELLDVEPHPGPGNRVFASDGDPGCHAALFDGKLSAEGGNESCQVLGHGVAELGQADSLILHLGKDDVEPAMLDVAQSTFDRGGEQLPLFLLGFSGFQFPCCHA